MEILSPAGNMNSVYAAVRSGADAVYVGLKEFSARGNAENFNIKDLAFAIKYCHIRDVKVYVAVNTMIKEKEFPRAVNAVYEAYNAGADAFIVSDMGLISVLHNVLPQAVLHGSTQMTVHSPAALSLLKYLGIKRVVLAREMSKEDIQNFCKEARKLNIEVEVFVHGALCMCVSGQCLMSSILGGRSGNRGLCAGPCRLEFSAKGSGRHDLCLKDLSLLSYIRELKEMGVCSAKIEGRMKRPEYVAAATSACCAARDGNTDGQILNAIKNVFSRSGFTDGYYTSHKGKDMFGVRTKEDVGISKTAFPFIHTLYRNERQSVPIKISAEIIWDKPISVTFTDNRGNTFTAKGALPQKAETTAADTDSIKSALEKLGGTPYYAQEINVTLGDNLYIKISDINGLRRNAESGISELRAYSNEPKLFKYQVKSHPPREKSKTAIYAKFLRPEQVPDNLDGVSAVILPFEYDFDFLKSNVIKIADLPRYITDENKVINRLNKLKSSGVGTAYCDNLSAFNLAKNAGFKIVTSNGFNCMNTAAAEFLTLSGAEKITLSAETYMPTAISISRQYHAGIIAYGMLPLMLTKNCPIRNAKTCAECKSLSFLTDRKGIKFPVVCRQGYSEILNSVPLYLADKREELNEFDFIILNFTLETSEKAREIIDEYISGNSPKDKFTRGLYYKDIL